MTASRSDHLAWCKSRALEILESGDEVGAVTSMLSDLGKWSEPLYPASVLQAVANDGMFCRHNATELRSWIEGFQ